MRAYYQGDLTAAQRLVSAALREDSTFAMAAYWVVKIGKDVRDPVRHQDVSSLRPIALRLAARAPDRERLMITADLLTEQQEPRAIAVAESLTTRYQHDLRAFGVLAHVSEKPKSSFEREHFPACRRRRRGAVRILLTTPWLPRRHSPLAFGSRHELWGRASLYGRDRKTHHYLRGMLCKAEGRCADAAREFQSAIHSPTMGFTRVNYELAECLIRLGRPRENAGQSGGTLSCGAQSLGESRSGVLAAANHGATLDRATPVGDGASVVVGRGTSALASSHPESYILARG